MGSSKDTHFQHAHLAICILLELEEHFLNKRGAASPYPGSFGYPFKNIMKGNNSGSDLVMMKFSLGELEFSTLFYIGHNHNGCAKTKGSKKQVKYFR